MLEPDGLENVRHGVPNGRRRGKREINDAKRNAKPTRSLLGDKLPDAGNLERGLLDCLAECLEISPSNLLKGVFDDTRPRDADVDDRISLSDAVKGSCHEGVVVGRIAEHDELRTAKRIMLLRTFRRLLHDFTHQANRVHVQSCLRGTDVDAGADALGDGEGLGNRANQQFVGGRHAL